MTNPLRKQHRIMLVSGEASGDQYAAQLIRQLHQQLPQAHCYGMGLAASKKAGAEILVDAKQLSTLGLKFITQLPQIFRAFRLLKRTMEEDRPDILVLIDYPDFNLRLAKIAHRMGIKVLYYISPKVWFWRRKRIKKIARWVDDMVLILPFEQEVYRGSGVSTHYFGHPLLNEISEAEIVQGKQQLSAKAPHVLLMPGSRPHEIQNHLPLLCQTAKLLQQEYPHMHFSLVVLPQAAPQVFQDEIKRHNIRCTLIENTYSNLIQADMALVAVGTAALQLALCQTPMLLLYEIPRVYIYLFKTLLGRKYAGLPNILLDCEVVPELIEPRLSAEALCKEASALWNSPNKLEQMRKDFKLITTMLQGNGGNISAQITQLIVQRIVRG